MRRILPLFLLTLGALAVTACKPVPPETPMTITAGMVKPVCLNDAVAGKVAPFNATAKVALQRTVNGKWVDWLWYELDQPDEKAHVLTATPGADGSFQIDWEPNPNGRHLSGTLHLRVRSARGQYVSPGFYATYPKAACS